MTQCFGLRVTGRGARASVLGLMDVSRIREARETVLEQERFQRELPLPEGDGDQGSGGLGDLLGGDFTVGDDGSIELREDYRGGGEGGGGEDASSTDILDELGKGLDLDIPTWLGDISRILLWVVIGVAVALALMWLVKAVVERGESSQRDARRKADGDTDASALPLPDPEALAAAGRFEEAVHALLLHALAHLGERPEIALAPSWTSREILRRVSLEEGPRGALSELVQSVERCHFGGRPAERADFEQCRSYARALQREARP